MDSPVFILSTGRTGTQFFEDYINQTTDKAICKHEPKPSRRFKFLSNLYLNNKVSDETIINIYKLSRKKLFKEIYNNMYLESSNFMFGCIPSLNKHYNNIKIIHIVRHPVDYVISHLNHGFWRGHKKIFARYVPYWLENVNTQSSLKNRAVSILSARWNYVNKQIASYAKTNAYILIKFEDLFSKDKQTSSETLNQIRDFLNISLLNEQENNAWLGKPKNFSKRSYQLSANERNFIFENNKELMIEYGYNE